MDDYIDDLVGRFKIAFCERTTCGLPAERRGPAARVLLEAERAAGIGYDALMVIAEAETAAWRGHDGHPGPG